MDVLAGWSGTLRLPPDRDKSQCQREANDRRRHPSTARNGSKRRCTLRPMHEMLAARKALWPVCRWSRTSH